MKNKTRQDNDDKDVQHPKQAVSDPGPNRPRGNRTGKDVTSKDRIVPERNPEIAEQSPGSRRAPEVMDRQEREEQDQEHE